MYYYRNCRISYHIICPNNVWCKKIPLFKFHKEEQGSNKNDQSSKKTDHWKIAAESIAPRKTTPEKSHPSGKFSSGSFPPKILPNDEIPPLELTPG